MSKLHIVTAIVIFTLAPALAATFNGGAAPKWMVVLAIAGLVIAAIALLIPTPKDVDL